MIYIVTINNVKYEVEVEKGQAKIVKTTEISTPVPSASAAPTISVAAAPAPSPISAVDALGEAVKAPMPGLILDVKVIAGQAVKKGAPLMILEAMKMENEILAPRDCVVKQVLVAKGKTVATDEPLAVLQ